MPGEWNDSPGIGRPQVTRVTAAGARRALDDPHINNDDTPVDAAPPQGNATAAQPGRSATTVARRARTREAGVRG
jgi:hypothetical protein